MKLKGNIIRTDEEILFAGYELETGQEVSCAVLCEFESVGCHYAILNLTGTKLVGFKCIYMDDEYILDSNTSVYEQKLFTDIFLTIKAELIGECLLEGEKTKHIQIEDSEAAFLKAFSVLASRVIASNNDTGADFNLINLIGRRMGIEENELRKALVDTLNSITDK